MRWDSAPYIYMSVQHNIRKDILTLPTTLLFWPFKSQQPTQIKKVTQHVDHHGEKLKCGTLRMCYTLEWSHVNNRPRHGTHIVTVVNWQHVWSHITKRQWVTSKFNIQWTSSDWLEKEKKDNSKENVLSLLFLLEINFCLIYLNLLKCSRSN